MKKEISPIIILFVIYFMANIPFLLNINSIYWDDWAWFYHNKDHIEQVFDQAQLGYKGDLFIILSNLGAGGYPFRLLFFISHFISAICLYFVINKTSIPRYGSCFYITLIFLLAPLYSSRVAPSVSIFYFPILLFFIGLLAFQKYLDKKTLSLRIISLTCFWVSFSTNSLLVFYFIIFILAFEKSIGEKDFNLKNFIAYLRYIIKIPEFILLPFVYFLYSKILLQPYGLYKGYNSLNFNEIISIRAHAEAFLGGFIDPIRDSFEAAGGLKYLITATILFLLIKKFFYGKSSSGEIDCPVSRSIPSSIILIGLMIFWLGAFPYVAVGKMPVGYNYDSRFQILLPLGFSIVVYFSIKLIFNEKYHSLILWLTIASFIAYNIKSQIKWNLEWYYTIALIERMKDSEQIYKGNTFLVDPDEVKNSKYIFNPYSINGMSKTAYSDTSRLFISNLSEYSTYKALCTYEHYNCLKWVPGTISLLKIRESKTNPFNAGRKSYINAFIKMKYFEIFDYPKFKDLARSLIDVELEEPHPPAILK